jgi:hypothetical protein
MQHRNAPLTPNGRRRLVALIEEDGLTKSTAHTGSLAGGRRTRRDAMVSPACETAPRRPPPALQGQ